MEAAGVILGVLPILISAAENYENVFKPFKRYKNFAPELWQYQRRLQTQKTIFKNECQLLLSALTGRQIAKQMLKEKDHPCWTDSALGRSLSQQLGSSEDACEITIHSINLKLKVIEKEAETFGHIIQQSLPSCSIGDSAWRSRVGKKLKFSISESKFNNYLDDLRNLNQDFRILASQITKLDILPPSTTGTIQKLGSHLSGEKIEEYRMVQKASAELYAALGKACQTHAEHTAQLRLGHPHVDLSRSSSSRVRFNLAFTYRTSLGPVRLDPFWIAVDSTFDDDIEHSATDFKHEQMLATLTQTLTGSSYEESLQAPKKAKTKVVRFAASSVRSQATVGPECLSTKTKIATLPTEPSLPDFSVQHNFCQQLESCGRQGPRDTCLGYFAKSGLCKHLVYFAPPIVACSITPPVSLAQIIAATSKLPGEDQFLQYEILRLARQLASAVLLFHATPFLKDAWRSNDIIFFDANSKPKSLFSPHLNVHVTRANIPNAVSCSKDNIAAHLVRNPYMFGLGITLIELAYQKPLHALYKADDLQDGKDNMLSDFFVASRLSKSITSSLGSTYGMVVRKCLECDFGQGTFDLNDVKLQATFYKDVICELERLERGFAMLQLAA